MRSDLTLDTLFILDKRVLSLFLFIPVICIGLGSVLNATLVRGSYEWLGLARISYELFDRPGFWCIAFSMWVAGLINDSDGLSWRQILEKRILLPWTCTATIIFWFFSNYTWNLPAGSFIDLLVFCYFLVGIFIIEFARYKQKRSALLSLFRTASIAIVVFFSYTAVAYFHTMVKGSLFILVSPNDSLLWKVDTLLLGELYYDFLAQWRLLNETSVRFLDVVYIGLLQQICWSIFFFHGVRDLIKGRRYLFAVFLIYIIGPIIYFIVPSKGPIFYANDLFNDIRTLAPDTWNLSCFLNWSTNNTIAGITHEISPFGFIAALPSLHIGIALIILLAMRRSLIATIFNTVTLIFTIAATNILGWHYAIDIIAGFILGGLTWWLACRISSDQGYI